MSRVYEVLVILKATGSEADLAQAAKQLEEPIQKLGGTVAQSSNWGRRRLTYPIARQQEGSYQLIQFHLPPDRLEELKRLLRLNESIVRFLILNRENHRAATPTA